MLESDVKPFKQLVDKWREEYFERYPDDCDLIDYDNMRDQYIAIKALTEGANREFLACKDWIASTFNISTVELFIKDRRPKPSDYIFKDGYTYKRLD